MRLAASADVHFSPAAFKRLAEVVRRAAAQADVLAFPGDLTEYGRPREMECMLEAISGLDLPIIALLGNHDHENEQQATLAQMLRDAGVSVLDGSAVEVGDVGFAGTKGFLGGFGQALLTPFGEAAVKAVVQEAIDESLKLERALLRLTTRKRVALLHYSPIPETLVGENCQSYSHLGTSRLADAIDRCGADLVLHGHAHYGSPTGRTPAGIPVYNVALELLEKQTGKGYGVFEV